MTRKNIFLPLRMAQTVAAVGDFVTKFSFIREVLSREGQRPGHRTTRVVAYFVGKSCFEALKEADGEAFGTHRRLVSSALIAHWLPPKAGKGCRAALL